MVYVPPTGRVVRRVSVRMDVLPWSQRKAQPKRETNENAHRPAHDFASVLAATERVNSSAVVYCRRAPSQRLQGAESDVHARLIDTTFDRAAEHLSILGGPGPAATVRSPG